MKTILLPTDFSANSLNAIFYARQLYKDETCQFVLLHAYKVDGYDQSSLLTPIPAKDVLEDIQRRKNAQLQELVDEIRLKSTLANQKWMYKAANQPLVQVVQEAITQYKALLVVIGTQGHTGSSEVVYGSNTVNLMEEIQRCPVLAVPAHYSFHPLKEVVLANSFKAELTPHDLKFLMEVVEKHKASIRILHILEEGGLTKKQKVNKQKLRENLEKHHARFSFHALEFLSIPLGIYSFTESRGSDMIALINKKHSLLETLLLDPVYKNLASFSKVPVLVLHQP